MKSTLKYLYIIVFHKINNNKYLLFIIYLSNFRKYSVLSELFKFQLQLNNIINNIKLIMNIIFSFFINKYLFELYLTTNARQFGISENSEKLSANSLFVI